MKDYRDIWKDAQGEGLSEEQLLAYLEGRLPEAEHRAVEEMLATEGLESDAIEGLQALGESEARHMRHKLNAALWRRIGRRRNRRRSAGAQAWSLIAIVVVLILAIVCFLVFRMLRG